MQGGHVVEVDELVLVPTDEMVRLPTEQVAAAR